MIVQSNITEDFVILQDTDKFKFGTDAVLLANFSNIKKKDTVVDFCSGTGAVGFISYLRYRQKHTILVDIDDKMVALSKETAKINNIEDIFSFISGDLKNAEIQNDSIDYITVNPPYFKEKSGKLNKNENLIHARHACQFSLDDLFLKAYKILKDGAKIALIHRAEYLSEIIYTMKTNKIEPKRLQLVQSHPNKNANLFLMEGVKNGGISLKCLPPLILYS